MTEITTIGLTEDALDTLVSIAIRRAEILEDMRSSSADEAWREVMVYEEQLARLTSPAGVPGGIARVGAVRAALAGGQRQEAARLAQQYLAEEALPAERREAMDRVWQEDRDRLARRFPALAERGALDELRKWRAATAGKPGVFPRAA
jgi:hypothetical protein